MPNGGVHFGVGIALLAADYQELRERRAEEADARPRVIAWPLRVQRSLPLRPLRTKIP